MTETTIFQSLLGMGPPGITGGLLLFFLNKYFEDLKCRREIELEKAKADVKEVELRRDVELKKAEVENDQLNKLCDKFDKFSDALHEFTVQSLQSAKDLEHMFKDMQDKYIRIATKQDSIKQHVEEIHIRTKLCPKQPEEVLKNGDNEKVPNTK